MARKIIGFGALIVLLSLGFINATSDHWEPPIRGITNEVQVDDILAHLDLYEEYEITIVSWIYQINYTPSNTTIIFMGVTGELKLLIPYSIDGYKVGDSIAIKGVAYLVSKGYVLVDDIHKINFNLTLIFSIIGGLLFLYYFLHDFKLDPKLNFKRRY